MLNRGIMYREWVLAHQEEAEQIQRDHRLPFLIRAVELFQQHDRNIIHLGLPRGPTDDRLRHLPAIYRPSEYTERDSTNRGIIVCAILHGRPQHGPLFLFCTPTVALKMINSPSLLMA